MIGEWGGDYVSSDFGAVPKFAAVLGMHIHSRWWISEMICLSDCKTL